MKKILKWFFKLFDRKTPEPVPESILKQINQIRAKVNTKPLNLSVRLSIAAQKHSEFITIKKKLSHLGHRLSTATVRAHKLGYYSTLCEENLVCLPIDYSLERMIKQMYEKPNAHMIKPAFTDIGIGITESDQFKYYVIMFATDTETSIG